MNKILLYTVIFLSSTATVIAQNGCTDTLATNYDPAATINDGTCIYANLGQNFTLIGDLLPYIHESSGVEFMDGFIWSHNDSGNSNEIFKIDTATGAIIQTVTITNFPNHDWEDITSDDQYLYIGDFGNNDGNRHNLMILKIDKNDLTSTAAAISVTPEEIDFSYTDQQSFTTSSHSDFNCEAFFAKGDSLYLFSKDGTDLKTREYVVSKTPGSYALSPVFEYDCQGLITGADYDEVKDEVMLIGYESGHYNSFIYYLKDFVDNHFFEGDVKKVKIGNSTNNWQTEGVCFVNNEIFISCEDSYVNASLYKGKEDQIGFLELPNLQIEQSNLLVYPNPVNNEDDLKLKTSYQFNKIYLISIDGKTIFEKPIESEVIIQSKELTNLQKGVYILMLESEDLITTKKIYLN